MAAAISGKPIAVFISYSRADSSSVDSLEAELIGYGFRPWVDRNHIEGGQHWASEIERAIQSCDVVVVTLSPDAVSSPWVKDELLYARQFGKPIIPVMLRPVQVIPLMLVSIQYVDLSKDAKQGIQQLRSRLLAVKEHAVAPTPMGTNHPASSRRMPSNLQEHVDDPTVALVSLPEPAPPEAINDLFIQGVTAWGHGDLDLAEATLRQVVERDPQFGSGVAAKQLEEAQRQLLPIQIQRLRSRAIDAEHRAAWSEAISAWQAIVSRIDHGYDQDRAARPMYEPDYLSEARRCLAIDQQNLAAAWIYANAIKLGDKKDLNGLRQMWVLLQQQAPHYGDTDRLRYILPTGTLLTTLESPDDDHQIEPPPVWSPNGSRIAITYYYSYRRDNMTIVCDSVTGRQIAAFPGTFAGWGPESQRIALIDRDSVCRLWDVHSGHQLAEYKNRLTGWAGSRQWLSSSRSYFDQAFQAWDAATGRTIAKYPNSRTIVWSPDGKRVAFVDDRYRSYDKNVRSLLDICDAATGSIILSVYNYHWKRTIFEISTVVWAPDGNRFASIENANSYPARYVIVVRDASRAIFSTIAKLDTHGIGDVAPRSLAWTPDGTQLVICGQSNSRGPTILVWKVTDGGRVTTHQGSDAQVSPDGRLLAFVSSGETAGQSLIRVWDIITGRGIATYEGNGVEWAPDNRRHVLSVKRQDNSNYTVHDIWDVSSGATLATYQATEVIWSPDGQRLLVMENYRNLQVWRA